MTTTKNLASFFTRDNPRKVWTLKENNQPEWLYAAIYEAHDGALPNDWVFEAAEAVCCAIDEGWLKDEDSIHEFADGHVDVYNSARWEWGKDMHGTSIFDMAEEESRECNGDADVTTTEHLGHVQYFALARIARIIFAAWEAAKEEEGIEALYS